MNKVFCQVEDSLANPLFEVFDGGDFVLSSYSDVESPFTEIQLYFPEKERIDEAKSRLAAALSLVGADAAIECEELPDEDWKLSYRRHFKVEPVGSRLVSVPAWEFDSFRRSADPALKGRVPIVLDPGMAFGTGKHETTRACLEYVDELSSEGGSFLDMGCGSGILSIAAAKLGYAPVAGFDIDEDAVAAARENAAANGVRVEYRVFALGGGAVTLDASVEAAKGIYPDLQLQGLAPNPAGAAFAPADLVVANILGPLLVAFADEISGYVRRRLVVSGILKEVYPEVLAAFSKRGFAEVSRRSYGEWTTALLVSEGRPAKNK